MFSLSSIIRSLFFSGTIALTLVIVLGESVSKHSISRSIYQDLEGESKPEFKLFEKAYLGYIDLKLNGMLHPEKNVLSIVDFRLSSKEKRMWVIDLDQKEVVFNVHVAHGKNSGEEYATYFSNTPNSLKSSLGFYITGETYYGKNGLSLKLKGLERGFNSNAFSRYIVLHGADYADSSFLKENGILGNSEGCPAVPMALHKEIINLTKGGTVFFHYYPDLNYLEESSYMMEIF
jgi:hypothetical protein